MRERTKAGSWGRKCGGGGVWGGASWGQAGGLEGPRLGFELSSTVLQKCDYR